MSHRKPVDSSATPAVTSADDKLPSPGQVRGYDLQRCLGQGAYGQVWVAVDRNTGRQVAMKFLRHRAAVDWALLSKEVEKLVFLSADRYVVQLLEVGWDADPAYYVMEFVENGSLDDLLQKAGPLPVPLAVEMFREIAIGMSHAHGKGVLHCDLKPANILLDQDHKPRLADFGQSRLTHEQTPALGTLFFMAPEQADLQAVPDASWDVYALGALLYCMLTGNPPHRHDQAVDEIDAARGLVERLARYRKLIEKSAPPAAHRRVPGMDGALAAIIDGCLSSDPRRRFPHVVSVLEALRDREAMRRRRPLQLLGILGPLLLLLTMAIFGYRGYLRAVADSEQLVVRSVRQANRFAAEGVARNVANELDKRFRVIEQLAEDSQLAERVRQLVTDADTAERLQVLASQPAESDAASTARQAFVDSEQRRPLQAHVERLMSDHRLPRVASWFVTDPRGTMLAAEFGPGPSFSRIGENFAYRSYFHGGRRDSRAMPQQPLSEVSLSAPFRSTATQTFKVAISAPIASQGTVWGVLVMTLELGQFVQFQTSPDQGAMLIDTRDDGYAGMVFQHPLYEAWIARHGQLPIDISLEPYRFDVERLRDAAGEYFEDPLSRHPLGEEYRGRWIMGTAPVTFPRRTAEAGDTLFDAGLLLVVAQRLTAATQPVKRLGQRLLREGFIALGVVAAVSAALWYFVLRTHQDPAPHTHRLPWGRPTPSPSLSMHARETLEMVAARSRNPASERHATRDP